MLGQRSLGLSSHFAPSFGELTAGAPSCYQFIHFLLRHAGSPGPTPAPFPVVLLPVQDDHPELLDLPGDLELSPWNRLVLLKALRPEKLLFGVQGMVSSYLGRPFTESPPFDLDAAYEDSEPIMPLIFVLSSAQTTTVRGGFPQCELCRSSETVGYYFAFCHKISVWSQ